MNGLPFFKDHTGAGKKPAIENKPGKVEFAKKRKGIAKTVKGK